MTLNRVRGVCRQQLTKIWGSVNFIVNYGPFVTNETQGRNKFNIFNALYRRIRGATWRQQLALNRPCLSVKIACGYDFFAKASWGPGKTTALDPTVRPAGLYPRLSEDRHWSGRRDSNSRPQPWQGCALPLSYARAPGHQNVRVEGGLMTEGLRVCKALLDLVSGSLSPSFRASPGSGQGGGD